MLPPTWRARLKNAEAAGTSLAGMEPNTAIESGTKICERPTPLKISAAPKVQNDESVVVTEASIQLEIPSSKNPTKIVQRESTDPRVAKIAATGVKKAIASARTRIVSPDSVAVKPSEFCTYCGRMKTDPYRLTPSAAPSRLPALTSRYRSTWRSTTGIRDRSVQTTKAASETTHSALNMRMLPSANQSYCCP